jgi:hypothetical protein
MKETLPSLASSPMPETGATDSPWQPSFLHWLISALSGTVEIEKQTAWLAQSNEELKKSNKELRRKNNRLAELESKLNEILHS